MVDIFFRNISFVARKRRIKKNKAHIKLFINTFFFADIWKRYLLDYRCIEIYEKSDYKNIAICC